MFNLTSVVFLYLTCSVFIAPTGPPCGGVVCATNANCINNQCVCNVGFAGNGTSCTGEPTYDPFCKNMLAININKMVEYKVTYKNLILLYFSLILK